MITRRSVITGLTAFIVAPVLFVRKSVAKLRDGVAITFRPNTSPASPTFSIKGKTYDLKIDGKPFKAGDLVAGSWPQTPGEFWPPVRGSTNWEPGAPIQSLLPNQQLAAIIPVSMQTLYLLS